MAKIPENTWKRRTYLDSVSEVSAQSRWEREDHIRAIREQRKGTQEGIRARCSLCGHASWWPAYSSQAPPAFCFSPTIPSYYKFIKGMIYRLSQEHDQTWSDGPQVDSTCHWCVEKSEPLHNVHESGGRERLAQEQAFVKEVIQPQSDGTTWVSTWEPPGCHRFTRAWGLRPQLLGG